MYITYIVELSLRKDAYSNIQSTLVISKSKGLSEILRDIRTSTYQYAELRKK